MTSTSQNVLIFQILKMTKDMEIKTGETITTAEVGVAISLEAVDTSKEAATRITTTKIETAAGEIGEAKEEGATAEAEIKEVGVTDVMIIEIEAMTMKMGAMEETAGETEVEVEVDMVADTKDKTLTQTTVVLISDQEPKGHQEVRHQALGPPNRKASPVDQDVSFMSATFFSKSTSKSSWNCSRRRNSILSEPDYFTTMREILKGLDLSK